MSYLVINRDSNCFNISWVSDVPGRSTLITQNDHPDLLFFDSFYTTSSINDDFLEIMAVREYEKEKYDSIIIHSEYDVLRAARLREYLNISGQKVNSAIAYRDKYIMKKLVSEANIQVPAFNKIESALDIYHFIKTNDFPTVIKPRLGMGGQGITVLRNMNDLELFLKAGIPNMHMVEKFVDAEMYHVDGIALNGNIIFLSSSKYLQNCLSYQDNKPSGSFILHPNNIMLTRLWKSVQKIISALPSSLVLAFHAEMFHTKDDEILLCEIASRIGGGRITETVQNVFGVNLRKEWARAECGLNVLESLKPKEVNELQGFLIIPPMEGVLESIPDSLPFEWIVDYRRTANSGMHFRKSTSSVDSIATLILKGSNEQILEQNMRTTLEWLNENIVWS